MSRLIVKNLPKVVNEQKLRKFFEQKGVVTDVQLKFKDGKFRQFAFIGYENENSAQKAVDYFNDTFFGTSKIKVEVCAALGDDSKPKSWSKYAKDSEAFLKKNEKNQQKESAESRNEKAKVKKIDAIIDEYKEDPQFKEFMKSHTKDKLLWENDLETDTRKIEQEECNDEDDTTDGMKLANQEISDAEYMKKLMNASSSTSQDSDKKSFEKKPSKAKIKLFTIKIRNIPKKMKREELKKFFRPSKAHSVRIPKNSNFAYVGFKLERDMKRALSKDKSFLKGKQIHVYEFTHQKEDSETKEASTSIKSNPRWQEQEDKLKGEEPICDSGKLFFRNLPYNVTEDDVQKAFEKYGSIVEVNVPIDPTSRKIKGFGTVTFLMPENAVQAYNELNGTMFHGRMFHLLPGKANDTKAESEDIDSKNNYKDKKRKELKKTAGSAHNWNTLFMGTNAVAEIMAKTYGKSKEEVLEGSEAAVRLALGETQVVLDMKNFLEKHGVRLESFDEDESSMKRSKTIILVKNLPGNTDVEEIKSKFEQFGVIEKIIMPPSSVTCLVKFSDPSEARKAFKKLAYSKFKHLPLYLEWAPENVFKEKIENVVEDKEKEEISNEKVKDESTFQNIETEEEIDDSLPESNTTLFIKNLNKTTVEETVRDTFKKIGKIHLVQIAKKKSTEDPTKWTPLGYGFIQFKLSSAADKALKNMQHIEIDGMKIELKRSDRTLNVPLHAPRKKVENKEQKGSTKIMIRNIPFQGKAEEIRQIFQVFGELKAVRLPKKVGMDQHRGFGFVDFVTKSDAKSAFEALHYSTHLYGRRLVLEWAASEENVTEIRKRTANDVHEKIKPKRNKKAIMKEEDFIKLEKSESEDE